MAREYFQCYHSYLQQMSSLSDAEFGRLIREALKYSSTGQSDPLPGKEDVAFPFVAFNIDRERQAYEEKCDKLRENGKKTKEAKDSKCKQMLANASKCREDKEKDKDKEQEKEYLPTEEEEKHAREGVSVSEIVNLYHSICVSFPKVQSISEKRKTAINARLKTYSKEQFAEMFRKAEASLFLKGSNDRDWSATFDWLIADSNFAKVLDGNYDDKAPKPAAEKPKKTRYTPNPTRNTENSFDISEAIMAAEMREKTEQEKWADRSMDVINAALERGKA